MSISGADLAALTGMYEKAGTLQLKEIEQKYSLGKSQIANALKIAQIESKDKRYGIEVQRELGLADIAQARLEMEKIGIPQVEINRWVAEKNFEVAMAELALKREVDVAGLTGMYEGNPTMAAREMENQLGLDQGALTGVYNGQRTLAGQQQDLEVAKFGQQLASTPDTYFQSRRFQAMDLPRLLGQTQQYGQQPQGGPTPGVARMGEFLGVGGGMQAPTPYAAGVAPTPYGGMAPTGQAAGVGVPSAPGEGTVYAGGSVTNGVENTAGQPQQDERAKQIAQIAKAVPPSPYDGLNEQDASTLKLMESIYKRGGQGVAGGELERLNASGRIGFLRSAGNLLGYDPKEFESQYAAYRPAQSDARLAG